MGERPSPVVDLDALLGDDWSRPLPPPPPGAAQALRDRAAREPILVRSGRIGRRGGVLAIQHWARRHLGPEAALAIRFDMGRGR